MSQRMPRVPRKQSAKNRALKRVVRGLRVAIKWQADHGASPTTARRLKRWARRYRALKAAGATYT